MKMFFLYKYGAKVLNLLTILSIILTRCSNKPESHTGGIEAKDALATFQVADGFKIEMVASEPLISDPVAMDVDEYGNVYVIELHGYPLDTAGLGKIKLLTDTDGDGVPDKLSLIHISEPTRLLSISYAVFCL